ncbi:glutamate--cysteine ligase [Candidatus Methylobacter oryzae]|uniref:Glutamate--cysteine ligase n=1 Tax=Candidatus Methylobacter oryzae TaxID=2497749 RepID=A0ABY3CGU7_9GAMM|nr:glutamate--cysteine ligase [Candidatus Methylobacter oryzae]TRX02936.1 glutamate--cysteine ligase [Candidatus Methylobacter oryzae]
MTNLNNTLLTRLDQLNASGHQRLLCGGLKGIEKESLRISKDGFIAQTPHPKALGSALTHPYITTDYSEALIELITPPFADVKDSLDYLRNIHRFVYEHLDNEILLGASMPCGIDGDESVPIAEYGLSNIGRMKHIYRHGLWHRYGRTMQSIAGIHFNYSVPEALWPVLHKQRNSSLSLEQFTADAYFGLIRNFQRMGWLILYLFGASPAICKNFFNSRPALMTQFEEFDNGTLYHPYATSLRMSDIGYKSKNQASLKIDYNSIDGYVSSLSAAINTPYPEYEKIGTLVDGEYRQLNSNILQIENEFYSTMRPKQIAQSGEKPTLALKRRGVRYIEMRSLDLDLFDPIGIDEDKARFIEALLLTCLLQDSPETSDQEQQVNNANQLAVANFGRKPGLVLNKNNQRILLKDWAAEILESIQAVCAILDQDNAEKVYSSALEKQQCLVENPDLTASARMLEQMTQLRQPFARFALNTSIEHERYFKANRLDKDKAKQFDEMAVLSHDKQQEIERKKQLPFDDFLKQYFLQA